MTTNYMTREERLSKEDAELQAAEAAFKEEHGTPATEDVVTDNGVRDTPNSSNEQPQSSDVDWEKRYKDLQSYHDKEKAKLQARLEEHGIAPEETDKVAELESQLAELQKREAERETTDIITQAQEAVHKTHPDFIDVISSPEFAGWIKEQPEVYQKAIYDDRPDARLASDALSLYKLQNGIDALAAQHKQMQDQAAMSVGGGQKSTPQVTEKKIWTWGEINSMSPAAYAKHESEIDMAFRQGLIQ